MGYCVKTIKLLIFSGVLLALAGMGEILLAILGNVLRPPINEPIDYGDDDPGIDIDGWPTS